MSAQFSLVFVAGTEDTRQSPGGGHFPKSLQQKSKALGVMGAACVVVPTPRPCPALTGKRGGELDNGWLSAEGVVAAGLAAVIILVVVQNGHLVRSAGDQRVGTLGLAVLPHLVTPACCCRRGPV